MTNLNEDTRLAIFIGLPLDARARLAVTCRQLRAAAASPSLWAALRFRGVTCRVRNPEATLAALVARARRVAGDAFACLDLAGCDSWGEGAAPECADAADCRRRLRTGTALAAALAADGAGASLEELDLGTAAVLSVADAGALATACPRLRVAAFALGFGAEMPGVAAAPLPHGCRVSVEAACDSTRNREAALAAALDAVHAADGALTRLSTKPLSMPPVPGYIAKRAQSRMRVLWRRWWRACRPLWRRS